MIFNFEKSQVLPAGGLECIPFTLEHGSLPRAGTTVNGQALSVISNPSRHSREQGRGSIEGTQAHVMVVVLPEKFTSLSGYIKICTDRPDMDLTHEMGPPVPGVPSSSG